MKRARNGHRFFIVDVFCQEKYSGNQLAVVVPDGPIRAAEMQRIAFEFNFPETTFILGGGKPKGKSKEKPGAYPVRIFTPRKEVPFAGHPTLGTAFIIRKLFAAKGTEEIALDVKAGRIPVRFGKGEGGPLWMKQLPPAFGKTHDAKRFAPVLGLAAKDFDSRFPIQQVSTGFEWLLAPLKNLAAVKKAGTDIAAYDAYFRKPGSALPILLFSPETYHASNAINARSFAHEFGIPEDPATGSANGCLAGYLVKHGYFGGGPLRISVEQGFEMGRNSILRLDAGYKDGSEGDIVVNVGGKVIEVAEGRLT